MTHTTRLLRLAIPGILVGILGVAVVAHAQDITGVSVSPVTFELSGNPGETLTNQMKVTNNSSSAVSLEMRIENIAGTGEQGQVRLAGDEDTPFALKSWITASPKTFSLTPKQTQVVNYTITIPKNAEPGGHYGSLMASTVATEVIGGTGSAISQRVGSILLVKVAGDAKESGGITKVQPKTFVGSWDEVLASDGKTKILVPRDEQLQSEHQQKYFSNGPIGFDVNYSNVGNVHFKPVGFLTIYNIFGKKIAEQALDPRNVFPGGERRITVIWPQKQLWGGYYRAQVVAVYGSSNQSLTGQASFWAFPFPALIGVIIALLVLLFARRRLVKVIRVLIKGH